MYPLLLPHQATDLLQTGERFRSRLTSGNQRHKRLIGIFVNPFAYTKSRAQKEWEGRGGHSKHTTPMGCCVSLALHYLNVGYRLPIIQRYLCKDYDCGVRQNLAGVIGI